METVHKFFFCRAKYRQRVTGDHSILKLFKPVTYQHGDRAHKVRSILTLLQTQKKIAFFLITLTFTEILLRQFNLEIVNKIEIALKLSRRRK